MEEGCDSSATIGNRRAEVSGMVIASLVTVILMGLFVENVIFATIERKPIRGPVMQD